MYGATMLVCEVAQMEQVQEVIAVPAKAFLAIVAALNDVQGNAGYYESGLSRHAR